MTGHPPSRARFVVLAFLASLSFVLYIDRICISQAVVPIMEDLHLEKHEMSYVLMAFTLAYGLFEVPTGHWGDRIGSRAVLTRIAVWWSMFTALTAACTGLYSLIAVRFLFGAGEAGAFPNTARIIARWFPLAERGRVQGTIQTTALLGGAVSPVLAATIIQNLGWRSAFVVFGGLGVIWAAGFWLWFRDDPARHPSVNPGELDVIGPAGASGHAHPPSIPWRKALTNPSLLLLSLITTCSAFNSYLYFSWFPAYLEKGRGVEPLTSGALASLVLGGGAAGTLVGGYLVDWIGRHGWGLTGRRIMGACAFLCAALLLLGIVHLESPVASSVCACLSCLAASSMLSAWWLSAIEISGRNVGALFGLMNSMGIFGAMGSQYFFGAFASWRERQGYVGRDQWDPAFYVVMGLLLVSALCWASFRSVVIEEREVRHEAGTA